MNTAGQKVAAVCRGGTETDWRGKQNLSARSAGSCTPATPVSTSRERSFGARRKPAVFFSHVRRATLDCQAEVLPEIPQHRAVLRTEAVDLTWRGVEPVRGRNAHPQAVKLVEGQRRHPAACQPAHSARTRWVPGRAPG